MPLLMVRNDITLVQADAIVNPANEYLLEGSGTSHAIYQAAGRELLKSACLRHMYCKVGEAVITDAFNMDARYIIHAVAPEWDDGFSNEEQTLYNAYKNSMLLAEEYKCESIAFPLISSGNMGFPKDRAMRIAINAISDFLMEHEMLVYLVLYDRDSVSVSEKLLGSIEQYIDDNYVDENDEILSGDELFPKLVREGLEERRYLRRKFSTNVIEIDSLADESVSAAPMMFEAPKLMNSISKPVKAEKRSLDSLINNMDETFSEMLLRLIDERDLKDSYVYNKANIDRRHFSKIRNNKDYIPTKKTVVAFAIALELTLDEAVDLLKRAGYAFSKSSKFDVIISFFLERCEYDIFEINEVLFHYGQPILGE